MAGLRCLALLNPWAGLPKHQAVTGLMNRQRRQQNSFAVTAATGGHSLQEIQTGHVFENPQGNQKDNDRLDHDTRHDS